MLGCELRSPGSFCLFLMIQIHIFFFSPPPLHIYLEGRSIFVAIYHACLTNRGRSLRGDSALPATSAYSNGATLNQCGAFFWFSLPRIHRSTGLALSSASDASPPRPADFNKFFAREGKWRKSCDSTKATKNSELSFQCASKFLLAFASGQEVGQEAWMLSSAVQQKFLFSFSDFPFCWRRHKPR